MSEKSFSEVTIKVWTIPLISPLNTHILERTRTRARTHIRTYTRVRTRAHTLSGRCRERLGDWRAPSRQSIGSNTVLGVTVFG